jgi:PHD/YefM family antitoxin component YafN of YafNO toxin-antitoxin module
MAREATTTTPIPVEEFSSNLEEVLDRVFHEHEEVLIENSNGELAVLKPAPKKRRKSKREITEEDRQAFLSSAGGWSDVDIDEFIQDIYESRRMSSRPPVEL